MLDQQRSLSAYREFQQRAGCLHNHIWAVSPRAGARTVHAACTQPQTHRPIVHTYRTHTSGEKAHSVSPLYAGVFKNFRVELSWDLSP